MAAKRQRRTSIRTAAGAAQERFLERVRALAADPRIVLPEIPEGIDEPKPLVKIRQRIERMASKGKASWTDKRDKSIVGAVANALPLAQLTAAPRLLDAKVGSQRRFFLQRGHVSRAASLGIQNHDEPRALRMAWAEVAKKHSFHFFAGPRFWCTGTTPLPPQEWLDELAKQTGISLDESTGEGAARIIGCGHTDKPRVQLGFRGGPSIHVCGPCGKRAGNLHQKAAERYASDRQRHPFTIHVVLPDGAVTEPDEKDVAGYRAGVYSEDTLIKNAVGQWRRTAGEEGTRFMLGDRDFGADQDAFLDALGGHPWEREVLRKLTATGYVSASGNVASVLDDHKVHLPEALEVLLGPKAQAFALEHASEAPRALVRLAHEEAQRLELESELPPLGDLGPLARWVDNFARFHRSHDRAAVLARLRRDSASAAIPNGHVYAFLLAIGGDPAGEQSFSRDDKQSGEAWKPLAEAVLAGSGKEYTKAVAQYLRETGSGERLS